MENFYPHSTHEVKSILMTSLSRLDIAKEAEKQTMQTLLNTDTNDFNFYDIPIDPEMNNDKNETKKIRLPAEKSFKSIHKALVLKGVSKQQKTFMENVGNNQKTLYQNKVREKMKKSLPNGLLFLGEMYT